MPLPLLAWGAIALISAGTAKVVHDHGYKKGYHKGKEEAQAEINRLRELLHGLQYEREKVKTSFEKIVNGVSFLDTKDSSFFAKIAAFFKGYTNFHVFVIVALSHARYRTLELDLDQESCSELKTMVLGFVHVGFPKNMKQDIETLWDMSTQNDVATVLDGYSQKLPETLVGPMQSVLEEIDQVVLGLKELSLQQVEYEDEIKENEKYLVAV